MVGNTGIGTSLVIIAAGAILAFAVDYELVGIDIQAVGGILLVVGLIGLLFSWLFLSSFSPMERRTNTTTYVDRPAAGTPPGNTQVNVNPPPPAEPPSRTEVNVNQPPPPDRPS